MSKTCKNCGNTFDDDITICPRCGMQYVETPAYQQPQYQQAQYQYQQPQYQQPVYPQPMQQEQPMTLGQWVGTILLTTMLGTVSLILLFVWGFSSNTPQTKKNYCRAMLIIQGISIVLAIIFVVIIMSLMYSNPEFIDAIENGYYF